MIAEGAVAAFLHLPWLALLLARTASFLLVVPFFSTAATPLMARGGLSLAVALMLYHVYPPAGGPLTAAEILSVTATEVLVGLLLGGLVRIVFAGLQLAGQLAGFGIGLSLARVIDPGAATEDSLGPALYQYLGIVLFLGAGGHRALLSALVTSYHLLPVGAASFSDAVVRDTLGLVGGMFQAGLRLAAPVASLLFLVDLLLALANRVVPQIPVLLVGMPVKAWLGIAALGWGLDAFAGPCLVWLERAPEIVLGASKLLARP